LYGNWEDLVVADRGEIRDGLRVRRAVSRSPDPLGRAMSCNPPSTVCLPRNVLWNLRGWPQRLGILARARRPCRLAWSFASASTPAPGRPHVLMALMASPPTSSRPPGPGGGESPPRHGTRGLPVPLSKLVEGFRRLLGLPAPGLRERSGVGHHPIVLQELRVTT